MLTAKTLLACFVPGMRYNTGFKKGRVRAGHFYGVDEFRRLAEAGVQLRLAAIGPCEVWGESVTGCWAAREYNSSWRQKVN